MPEIVKEKKLRLYKFASEYNLSTDSLMEFLQKKGYDVKTHMTILSDDMLEDIRNHFKKDIEKAEKHYKKISEFQKKRIERTEPTEAPVETIVEEQPHVVEETPVAVEETDVEEAPVQEEVIVEETAPNQEERNVEQPVVEEVTAEPEPGSFKTKTEIELETKKKGLTIVLNSQRAV